MPAVSLISPIEKIDIETATDLAIESIALSWDKEFRIVELIFEDDFWRVLYKFPKPVFGGSSPFVGIDGRVHKFGSGLTDPRPTTIDCTCYRCRCRGELSPAEYKHEFLRRDHEQVVTELANVLANGTMDEQFQGQLLLRGLYASWGHWDRALMHQLEALTLLERNGRHGTADYLSALCGSILFFEYLGNFEAQQEAEEFLHREREIWFEREYKRLRLTGHSGRLRHLHDRFNCM